jgi:L-aminopeptidase/D-esterase-like protein
VTAGPSEPASADPGPLVTAGPTNSLLDVAGLRVGHARRVGDGYRTGTTVVLAPAGGMTAGVDVRGAAPGTRETELLDPRNLVEKVHAIVLTGGSAFGLAAATGVMDRLADAGAGFPVAGGTVPIVPAAVIYDLGRGGRFRAVPDPALGAAAYDAAVSPPRDPALGAAAYDAALSPPRDSALGAAANDAALSPPRDPALGTAAYDAAVSPPRDPALEAAAYDAALSPPSEPAAYDAALASSAPGTLHGAALPATARLKTSAREAALSSSRETPAPYGEVVDPGWASGSIGAGTGAVAGGLAGGVGTASVVLPSGVTVAALAVVNAAGSVLDPTGGGLAGTRYGLPGEFGHIRLPDAEDVAAWRPAEVTSFNTTIGVVATDLILTKAQCGKLAAVAHDGLARAIRPAHTMTDGDTVFGLATGVRPAPDDRLYDVLAAAADAFSRAVAHAVLAATGRDEAPAYLDVFPSALKEMS